MFNVEGRRYNAPLLVGMLDYFQRRYPYAGFFQPVAGLPFAHSDTGLPRHVELLHSVFGLHQDPHNMSAITRQTCVDLLANGREDEMMDQIFEAFQAYRSRHDLVVLEGTHEDGPIGVPGDRLELNARIAAAINAPVLMVLDAPAARTPEDLAKSATIAHKHCTDEGAEVLGVVLNQVPAESLGSTIAEVSQALQSANIRCLGGLPHDKLLATVRLDAVAAGLEAQLVAGREILLDASADEVVIAAGSLIETLADIEATKGRPLVVTPATRPDIILGIAAAQVAVTGSHHPAGILVTDADRLDGKVRCILDSGRMGDVFRAPVLLTQQPLRAVLDSLARSGGDGNDMLPTSHAKIEQSKVLFERHVDAEALAAALNAPPATERQTPKSFMHELQQRCLANKQRIVLPEGSEPRVLQAAAEIARRGLADVILLGKPEELEAEAAKIGVDISACTVVDHETSLQLPKYVDMLCEARKHKGTTREMAEDMLQDVNYFGTMAVAAGDADGMVSGSVHTTAATIRPGLQVLRSKEQPLVSSVFFMCLPDRVLVYGDCAVNVNPTAADLAQIASASADTATAFGIDPPRVAMLSYSTGVSGKGAEVEKVKEAVALVKQQRPDLLVEGPIQYDAAVDPAVAAVKIKGGNEVAGRANVLIFPDLNTGNVGYKAVQQSTGAIAMGPIMQGLRLPVNDLSRGCTVPDIVNTVTCTAVQALAARSKG